MKKEIREIIEKLEMTLIIRDNDWAIGIEPKNAPNKQEVSFIKSNRKEIIDELHLIKKEKSEKEKIERENTPIKVELRKMGDYQETEIYVVTENQETAYSLGIGKHVGYWGMVIKKEIIEILGTEFTVAQARQYLAGEKGKKEIANKEKLETFKKTARELGHKVEIDSYTVDCDGTVAECDTDIITKYIDGKGNITISRAHTH